jgi:uncharacterized protein (TIGR02001 family)
MMIRFAAMTGLLLLAAQSAHAEYSSTITLASEYQFRGFSQSARDPALQASFDYELPSGFTVGAWASNVDFDNDADFELDLYATYTGMISEKSNWSVGFTWYDYPSSDDVDGYPEIFAGLTFGPVEVKQWYSNDFFAADEDALYTEANVSLPLQGELSLQLHGGYSWGDYWDLSGGELFDYSAGLGYTFNKVDLALSVTGTDASGNQKITSDVLNNEARVLFSVSTTLPWK